MRDAEPNPAKARGRETHPRMFTRQHRCLLAEGFAACFARFTTLRVWPSGPASPTSVQETAPDRHPPEVEPAPPATVRALASPPLPRAVHVVSWAVVAAGVTMTLRGGAGTGISWDEPFPMRLRNHLDHGWFSPPLVLASGGSTTGDNNTLVYGPVTMLLLHGLCVCRQRDWNTIATTPGPTPYGTWRLLSAWRRRQPPATPGSCSARALGRGHGGGAVRPAHGTAT